MRRAVLSLILASAVIAGFLWSPSEAGAQSARRVMVLPLMTDFLSEGLARQLEEGVREEVGAAMPQYILLPRPALDLTSLKVAAGCADDGPKCLALIGRTTGAQWVVQVSLQGRKDRARLLVQRVPSRRASQGSMYEAQLSDVGAASTRELRWHVATALGVRPAPLRGRIVLMTGSKVGSLQGARILLDDRRIPASGLEQVNPGRHRVEVRQTGFEPFVWSGAVRPGRDTPVRVRFVPRDVLPSAPPKAPPPVVPTTVAATEESSGPVWTWVLGAGAVVAAGTATVFGVQVLGLEADAEDDELDCDGEHKDNSVCEDGRSRALLANITWGVAGALAVGAVVSYFIETSGDDEPDAVTTTFGVAPTDDGVAASLQLTF